ncbi:MAG: ABC transporter substrate-binding protein [Chloroflexota bacterium]
MVGLAAFGGRSRVAWAQQPPMAVEARSVAGQSGAILRSAEPFGAPSLDPANAIISYIIQFGMGECLMRITPGGTLEPWLAESVSALDAQRWRIRLKGGIGFWNGRTVDASAVRGAILRVVEKRRATAALLDIASVDVMDGLTLDVQTRSPNGAFVASLAGANLIIHDADEAARVGDEAFGNQPVLTGSFIPTEFRPREMVTARRNDAYWQGAPGLDGFTFRAVSDANARLAAVLAGDVDMARQIPVQGIAAARSAGLSVLSGDEQTMNQIYLNHSRPPFDELAVRQAVSAAVDRDSLVTGVLEGSGTAATGPYPSFFPFADPRPLAYDPAAAASLLDTAGWTLSGDGIRYRGGEPLAFELTTYPQRPELALMATVIQSQLAQVGMSVSIRSVEQITPVVNNRDYQATMWRLGTTPTADPGFVLNTVYSSSGADNRQLGYQSARVDGVIARLNVASDVATRQALAIEAQGVLRDEVPSVFLLSPKLHIAHAARVKGLTYHPFDFYLVDHRISLS